jgi:hypothetical protein
VNTARRQTAVVIGRIANIPVAFASLFLVFYAISGLWRPGLLWLWFVFLLSPLLIGAWIALFSYIIRKRAYALGTVLAALLPVGLIILISVIVT